MIGIGLEKMTIELYKEGLKRKTILEKTGITVGEYSYLIYVKYKEDLNDARRNRRHKATQAP